MQASCSKELPGKRRGGAATRRFGSLSVGTGPVLDGNANAARLCKASRANEARLQEELKALFFEVKLSVALLCQAAMSERWQEEKLTAWRQHWNRSSMLTGTMQQT